MSEKSVPVMPGINQVVEHDGARFLIECEDRGRTEAAFELRVIRGGSLLWEKRVPYEDLLARELSEGELGHELAARAEKTIQTVRAAIARGRIA
jgi:hypothetical protein